VDRVEQVMRSSVQRPSGNLTVWPYISAVSSGRVCCATRFDPHGSRAAEGMVACGSPRTHVAKPHTQNASGSVARCAGAPSRSAPRCVAAPVVEPVIGHMKAEHRMGLDYLKGRDGERINAVLAAAGYNFGLLLRWLERLLRALMQTLPATPAPAQNA
jgi:hypothetical protein